MTNIAIREVQQENDISEEMNLFNPQENVKYGTLLLEHYMRTCGSLRNALICYNGGYGALIRYKQTGQLPEETKAYVPKVLTLMRNLDPMFQRQLPERRERSYLELAIDDVFYDLYGVGTEYQ